MTDYQASPHAPTPGSEACAEQQAPEGVRKPYSRPVLELHDTIAELTGDVVIDFGTS